MNTQAPPKFRLLITFSGATITAAEVIDPDQYVLTLEQFRELEAKAGNVTVARAALAALQEALKNYGVM